jgi:predicted SAM-dependent methyltransferase
MNELINQSVKPVVPENGLRAFVKNSLPPPMLVMCRHGRNTFRDFISRRRARLWFARQVREGRRLWLELGAGPCKGKNGWTTLDEQKGADVRFDLTWPFPLPDRTVEKFYTSHVLEHFFYEDLMRLLRECHRVLTPGGTFLACVPDASPYIKAYTNPESLEQWLPRLYTPAFNYHTSIDFLNYMAYMKDCHRHLFDEAHLIAILKAAGFAEACRRDFDPTLDSEGRRFESIYVSARKA